MPPPPCELLVTARPSMRDGLHWKLLGNGLVGFWLLVRQRGFWSPVGILSGLVAVPISSVVPAGKPASSPGVAPLGNRTPLDSTVIPAPSYAPNNDGSCNCSARLPFSVASQPTVASNGKRSTCGFEVVGWNLFH